MVPACNRLLVVGGWGVRADMLASLYHHWQGEVVTVSLDDELMGCCDSVQDAAAELLRRYPEPAHWMGWSLGAQVVMAAADAGSDAVVSVITLAGFPRFVAGDNWPTGMPAGQFRAFAQGIARAPERYWLHFQLLMINGSGNEAGDRTALKPWLEQGCSFSSGTLEKGLQWLGTNDQRDLWAGLDVPALHLLGARDLVVPCWKACFPCSATSVVTVIPGMGHWPGPPAVAACAPEIDHFVSTCGAR